VLLSLDGFSRNNIFEINGAWQLQSKIKRKIWSKIMGYAFVACVGMDRQGSNKGEENQEMFT